MLTVRSRFQRTCRSLPLRKRSTTTGKGDRGHHLSPLLKVSSAMRDIGNELRAEHGCGLEPASAPIKRTA